MAPNASGIRAGQAYVEISGDDAKLREASKRSEQYLRDVGKAAKEVNGASGNFFERLAGSARTASLDRRKSGEAALERALASGGGLTNLGLDIIGVGLPAVILEQAGRGLNNMTKRAVELKNELNAGKITAGDMVDELAGGVPVFGQFWQAGRNIREMFTGEKAEIAAINEEAKRIAQQFDAANSAALRFRTTTKEIQESAYRIRRDTENLQLPESDRAAKAVTDEYDDRIKQLEEDKRKALADATKNSPAAVARANLEKAQADYNARFGDILEQPGTMDVIGTASEGVALGQKAKREEAIRARNAIGSESAYLKSVLNPQELANKARIEAEFDKKAADLRENSEARLASLREKNQIELGKQAVALAEEAGKLDQQRRDEIYRLEDEQKTNMLNLDAEAIQAQKEQQERQFGAEADMAAKIEEEKIRLGKKGIDQRLALLELERREALRNAKDNNLNIAGQINTQYDMKRQLELQRGIGVTGSFSAAQIAASGGGVKEQNALLKKIEQNTRDIKGATFQ